MKTIIQRNNKQTINGASQPNAFSQATSDAEVIQINRVENLPSTQYVSQEEFSALAETLTEYIGEIKKLNRSQTDMRLNLNSLASNVSFGSTFDPFSSKWSRLWKEVNSTKNLVSLLENVIGSLSTSNIATNQNLAALERSVNLLQSNASIRFGGGLYSEEFIRLLDTSVRELRVGANEQRKSLNNQRRRIRQLEGKIKIK